MNATIATMLKMELWQADGIMDYSNWHSSNRCSVGRKVGGSKQLLGGENARHNCVDWLLRLEKVFQHTNVHSHTDLQANDWN